MDNRHCPLGDGTVRYTKPRLEIWMYRHPFVTFKARKDLELVKQLERINGVETSQAQYHEPVQQTEILREVNKPHIATNFETKE